MPEVIGKKHEFTYSDYAVTVSLPSIEMLTPLEELMKLDYEEHEGVLLSFHSYREENGIIKPIFYEVGYVDVTVNGGKEMSLPPEILNQQPNAYDLLSTESQNRLDKIATEHGRVAEQAFNYWIGIIRWQSGSSAIGRPEIRSFKSGWGTYLRDEATRKRIWHGGTQPTTRTGAQVTTRVNLEQWNNAEALLKQGVHAPIYLNYYFDAVEHFDLMDLERCVIDLAISCEVLMKTFVREHLPAKQPDSIKEQIERTNINVYYEKFLPDMLEPAKKKNFLELQSGIKALFKHRNAIVHGGASSSLTPTLCKELIETTKNFIDLF
ncbi:MAG: hypothetical protein ACOYZ6_19785 [Chloroflexota bacterium]